MPVRIVHQPSPVGAPILSVHFRLGQGVGAHYGWLLECARLSGLIAIAFHAGRIHSCFGCSCRLVGIGIACALASSASAQLLTHKDLSAGLAVTIAQTAMATCTANGYRVSATVVGRNGEVLVQIRGDGTGPHTMENSFKKAFTARTFRIPSGEMEERLKKNPQMGAQYLTGFTTARGALPIKVGEEVIGAAGVSGAPGGEKDEACVQAALDKAADQLK
jgi:uncharacterized protein GlcG (DUF336 family)